MVGYPLEGNWLFNWIYATLGGYSFSYSWLVYKVLISFKTSLFSMDNSVWLLRKYGLNITYIFTGGGCGQTFDL